MGLGAPLDVAAHPPMNAKKTSPTVVDLRMTALGQKRSFQPDQSNVRFTPQSGHSFTISPMAAFDPKRTFPVVEHRVGKAGAGFGTISGGDA